MKITKKQLEQLIKEEILKEGLLDDVLGIGKEKGPQPKSLDEFTDEQYEDYKELKNEAKSQEKPSKEEIEEFSKEFDNEFLDTFWWSEEDEKWYPKYELNENKKSLNEEKEQKKESIFDAKPGETIIFNFDGITIKLKRQLDDLFKVVDASESHKLKDGDYLKAKGNDVLETGRKFKFAILREIPVKYETRPLSGWNIIRN